MRVEPFAAVALSVYVALASATGRAEPPSPGDAMIRDYLARDAAALQDTRTAPLKSPEDWKTLRPRLLEDYFDMLGLSPRPERTPLNATVTGTVQGDGFTVENLHYQSVPGLYVTANLYRPSQSKPGERFPGVLYVCGHSMMGRDGNKTAYQSNGIWLARHGYVCLTVDTLQLGEIAGVHHGTYREGRWWWHSRGYTPAGVECWNGVRGLDYLAGRPDVDPEKLAVTGISGGGAATFWVAAADDRVKAAVPISGMADLVSYVGDRVVNGHCDCMFLYNTYRWPWVRIAGLVAPRPLLFVNSDSDPIFPMDANERVINRLERHYSLFGAGDLVGAVVSVGGHAYRTDIRRAAFRFLNTHLKNDPRPVDDSEVDLVTGSGTTARYPIEPKRLRAFPADSDIPADQKNGTIDRHFVPMAKVDLPPQGGFPAWKDGLLAELRRRSFRTLLGPGETPPAIPLEPGSDGSERLETEAGIVVHLVGPREVPKDVTRVVLRIAGPEGVSGPVAQGKDGPTYVVETRGTGRTRWSVQSPPNTVARAHVLVGRTVDGGRVRDAIATARHLRDKHGAPVVVEGTGPAAVVGAYAALLEPEIAGVVAHDPPASHMDADAPQFLNVLRVLDVPEALGLLAPRPLTLSGNAAVRDRVAAIYAAAGARDSLATP